LTRCRHKERWSTQSRPKKVGAQSQPKEGRGHAVDSRKRGDTQSTQCSWTMFDAFGGGGVSQTIKVLLLGVDSVQCNTRQRRNDKQRKLIDVGSINWNRGRGEAVTNTNSRRRFE
jgi:hypothetical protein